MQFEGEHLLPGQIGHFFVLLAFVASVLATIGYFNAGRLKDLSAKASWIRFARISFYTELVAVLAVFSIIFYICSQHYFEYMYAYKHASKELESKYLLACIWEGQEGSFLLWTIWHCLLGVFIIWKEKEWEAPVMTALNFAQFFLLVMLLGLYFGDIRIGSSPFVLTRNEINGPIFSQPDYLNYIKDGVGLNVLLRNYWMVIHPPVLFLGFAACIVPFGFAFGGLQTKRFGDWVKPALPWALFGACVLGVGIMMGGKWAYESLSFGGYWAWDPVENASLVPWMILVAGLHTMVIYKATGRSLKASYVFIILSQAFVLYSTFLTRTGILGDTSVHAFTEKDEVMKLLLELFFAVFTIAPFVLFFKQSKNMQAAGPEEKTDSREFWMFIGSIVFFLSAIFIIAKTSVPVYNKIFGTKFAPPEDAEFSYNKVMVMVAFIIGVLTAIAQYFKYKSTPAGYILKKIAVPTLTAAIITILLAIFYPLTFYKHGAGFLGALYIALFASIYAAVANAMYIWSGLNGKIKSAGGSITHLGFAVMMAGMIISSSNKKTISDNSVTGINIPFGKDEKGRDVENPMENLTLLRDVPTRMLDYNLTYRGDSAGHENGRKFYKIDMVSRDSAEHFELTPDIYLGKNELKSSNPSTKRYLTKDIYSYISSINPGSSRPDTAQFAIKEIGEGDTAFFNKGYFILNRVIKNPDTGKYHFTQTDAALMADITLVTKDGRSYKAAPLIQLIPSDSFNVKYYDDTLFAQNMYLRFAGVTENRQVKIGIKESDTFIDFITLKAYLFPYINLVWLGLVVMAMGLLVSMVNRSKISKSTAAAVLVIAAIAMCYMFFIAGG
ncbi:MAG: cytochrome c biogenesis protein CcsA [Ferruginibacter sp.]